MKIVKLLLLGIVLLALTQCSYLRTATLIKSDVSQEYLEQKYGKITRSSLYFSVKYDFEDLKRMYKESILASGLPKEEKEKVFEEIKKMEFEENRYLVYFFRLHEPTLVSPSDIQFAFNDKQGDSIIEKIIHMQNKVTVTMTTTQKYTTTSASQVSYNYAWIMKLKKPFVKENYAPGKYDITLVYANGQKALYEISL